MRSMVEGWERPETDAPGLAPPPPPPQKTAFLINPAMIYPAG
jgi:hypothetical protein